MMSDQFLHERSVDPSDGVRRMRQNVHSAVDGDANALKIRWVSKDKLSMPVALGG